MATVDLTNWDEKNTGSVSTLSDGSSLTGLNKVQPIKVSEGSNTGAGDAQFSSSTWDNISANDDLVVTEADESTTRPYEIESLDTTNNEAWLWVYGSWDRDGSDQIVVGAGTGDGTDYSQSGTGANPWGQTGVNAEMVQHLQDDPLTATDSTANNNDGTVEGAVSTTGQFDGAGSFDGTDDQITVENSSQSYSTSDTVEKVAWIKTSTSPENDFSNAILSSTDGSEGDTLYLQSDNTVAVATFGSNTSGSGVKDVVDNLWHQIVLKWDQSNSNVKIFIDGELDHEVTSYSDTSSTTNADLAIGNEVGSTKAFAGDIDEGRWYTNNSNINNNWVQADYDASPKGGQTFFSWSGAEAAVQTSTDTAVTTNYQMNAQTSTETNNRVDTATTTSYTMTPIQTTEQNDVTDDAVTTGYVMTAQQSLDGENFTDTATTTSYTMTGLQSTESQVNVDTAVTSTYQMSPQTSSETVINVDTAVTTTYEMTAQTTAEQNNVTATAQPTNYVMTGETSNETVTVFDTAQTSTYEMTAGQSNEVIVDIDTAITTTYEMTAGTSTELEIFFGRNTLILESFQKTVVLEQNTFKKGDTNDPYTATIRKGGRVRDLQNADTVEFFMEDREGNLKVDAGTMMITNADNGEVEYNWSPSDVDTAGIFRTEIKITFDNGKEETYPSNDYQIIEIEEDLESGN